ncbi:hypothetical protein AVEN_46978-1, partial [Araneus ventricosus]
LPSAASQGTSVEACDTEPECSKNVMSSSATPSCDTSGHLQDQQHRCENRKFSHSENKIQKKCMFSV